MAANYVRFNLSLMVVFHNGSNKLIVQIIVKSMEIGVYAHFPLLINVTIRLKATLDLVQENRHSEFKMADFPFIIFV